MPEIYDQSSKGSGGNVVPYFDSIPETIESFARGEFIVVMDDTNRENEGDLIIAAEHITTEKMAFMIRHTSGLICAPMTPQYTEALGLPQMVPNNTERHGTAYTVSCDLSEGTTTGISAHDRALTVKALASPKSTATHFRRPGHIFPLRSVAGGVVARTGHTEASTDFCRLAGLREVAAICELVKEWDPDTPDGREAGMMRRDDCMAFARKWGFKICTIEDLREHILNQNDPITTKHGNVVKNGIRNGLKSDVLSNGH